MGHFLLLSHASEFYIRKQYVIYRCEKNTHIVAAFFACFFIALDYQVLESIPNADENLHRLEKYSRISFEQKTIVSFTNKL